MTKEFVIDPYFVGDSGLKVWDTDNWSPEGSLSLSSKDSVDKKSLTARMAMRDKNQ